MQVPPGGKAVVEGRTSHEGGVVAETAADLFDGRAEQQRVVGGSDPSLGRERELDLSRAPFVLDAEQREAEAFDVLLQGGEQLADLVAPALGQVLKAVRQPRHLWRVGRVAALLHRQARVLEAEHVELALETGDELVAGLPERVELAPQDTPGREGQLPPAREIGVAQDPTRLVHPRQDPKRRRIRHEHPIRESVQLGYRREAAGGERGDDRVVGRVEDGGDELEVLALLQRVEERRDGERLAPRDPVLVAPTDADLAEPELLDASPDFGGRVAPSIVPEAVSLDERSALGTSWMGCSCGAGHGRPPRCWLSGPLSAAWSRRPAASTTLPSAPRCCQLNTPWARWEKASRASPGAPAGPGGVSWRDHGASL